MRSPSSPGGRGGRSSGRTTRARRGWRRGSPSRCGGSGWAEGRGPGRAGAAAGGVVVAPIYAAREQPLAGVSADLVARGAAGAGATTIAVRERAGLTDRVVETVRAGDVVFTLGAGDITRVGPELLARLGNAA